MTIKLAIQTKNLQELWFGELNIMIILKSLLPAQWVKYAVQAPKSNIMGRCCLHSGKIHKQYTLVKRPRNSEACPKVTLRFKLPRRKTCLKVSDLAHFSLECLKVRRYLYLPELIQYDFLLFHYHRAVLCYKLRWSFTIRLKRWYLFWRYTPRDKKCVL